MNGGRRVWQSVTVYVVGVQSLVYSRGALIYKPVFDIGFGDRVNRPGSERDENRAERPNARRSPVELVADCESTMAVE